MRTLKDKGQYTVKETGDIINYEFEFPVYDDLADIADSIGDEVGTRTVNRQAKVDNNNVAREKAKSANGHSTRTPLTAEQKAENKATRQANSSLLDALKAKGLTLADIESM